MARHPQAKPGRENCPAERNNRQCVQPVEEQGGRRRRGDRLELIPRPFYWKKKLRYTHHVQPRYVRSPPDRGGLRIPAGFHRIEGSSRFEASRPRCEIPRGLRRLLGFFIADYIGVFRSALASSPPSFLRRLPYKVRSRDGTLSRAGWGITLVTERARSPSNRKLAVRLPLFESSPLAMAALVATFACCGCSVNIILTCVLNDASLQLFSSTCVFYRMFYLNAGMRCACDSH